MSNKFKEYARMKSSLKGTYSEKDIKEIVNPNSRISFKPVVDMGKDFVNDMKSVGAGFVDDVKRGFGINDAEDAAADYANGVLNRILDVNKPVDARSTSDKFAEIVVGRQNFIALIENLSMINGLPPIPDNIVDPPPTWEKSEIKKDLDSWSSGLIGKDYLQRVIARGQFLVLVPIDIQPRLLGNIGDKGANAAKTLNLIGLNNLAKDTILSSMDTRLNNASYGLTAKVNSLKYYRAVNAHMKAAMLSLGIDIEAAKGSLEAKQLSKYLPDEIVKGLVGDGTPAMLSIQNRFLGSESNSDVDSATKGKSTSLRISWGSSGDELSKIDDNFSLKEPFSVVKTNETAEEFIRKANYENLLKFLTNVNVDDEVIKSLPFSIFYCNGPIEKGLATSSSLGESSIARMTTDIGSKAFSAATAAAEITGLNASEDYIREMAYHRNLGSFLVSNTYVPNIIKSSMIDFQYTVNIRDVAVSSDRYSIVRLFWTLSQLFPFVIQTNEPGSALVVPSSPMYCGAFSKGVMNLPRAAITNLSIKTNPEFQTTEGIPTELDITITIQPLFSQSTMPNFDKFYDGTNNPQYLAAAMFNPLSSFNIIATLCGQNTILTRFQAGLIQFFLGGTISTVYSSIKNTGTVLSGAWRDWWSSTALMSNEVYSRTRIIGI